MTLLLGAGIVAVGVLIGLLSAVFGVGGGIVMIPFMTLGLDMSQHTAEGTSLVVIVPTAIAGIIAHRRLHRVGLRIPTLLSAGGVFGSYAGASLALRIDGDILGRLFGGLVVAAGVRLIWSGAVAVRRTRRELELER